LAHQGAVSDPAPGAGLGADHRATVDGAYGRDLKTLLSAAERATRELWGRIPPPSQHQQLLAHLSQRAALTNAVTRLRENQDRAAQAAAARRAGERVRLIAAQPPPLHPPSRRRPPGRESGRRGGLSTSAGPDRSGPGTS
jgi:hypothetical protein